MYQGAHHNALVLPREQRVDDGLPLHQLQLLPGARYELLRDSCVTLACMLPKLLAGPPLHVSA